MESFGNKLVFALKSLAFTPVIYFIEKYIWNDWNLLITVILLLLGDALALLIRSLFDKNYSLNQAFGSFGLKTVSIALVVYGVGVFDQATIKGNHIEILKIINTGFYTMILGFLLISFLTNIYKIYPWKPIEKMLNKLNRLFENEKD